MSREIACNCIPIKLRKNLNQLNEITADARHEFAPIADVVVKCGLDFEETLGKLRNKIYEAAELASQVAYDTQSPFPKREEALERVCRTYGPGDKIGRGQCDIVEEHGDGDLTVKTEDNVFVITTDGRIFREIQPLDR